MRSKLKPQLGMHVGKHETKTDGETVNRVHHELPSRKKDNSDLYDLV